MLPDTGLVFAPGYSARRWMRAGWLPALFALAAADPAPAAPPQPSGPGPWAFNLDLYMWLPGIDGKVSARSLSRSVDKNFIDIVDASHSFPLGFMGRFEARYERFGLYLDGNWADLDFKRKTGPRGFASVGLETELGILDYGVMYRVAGLPDLSGWQGRAGPNRLDLYAGARTIWLDNTLTPQRLASVSASKSLTSPVVGGRMVVDFSRDWFVRIDGNVGGFGVQNVGFTGGILGGLGYRATLFDVPVAVEAGYKALRIDVSDKAVATKATLNGPFLGVTAFW